MVTHIALRRATAAAGASSSASSSSSALLRASSIAAAPSTFAKPSPVISRTHQIRQKSGPYGYTQAKSLFFSKYGEPKDVLQLHKYSISPSIPSGHILLRSLAASINPADFNTIQGTYGVKPVFNNLLGTPEPSVIPGNEGVFEVVTRTPPEGSGIQHGSWVVPAKTGFGTWRTHVVCKPEDVLAVDKQGLSPIQVGQVAVNPLSAYRMLRDFASPDPLREGDWFIQNGANSGVGQAAIQLGRLWGYHSVNVIRARETEEATQKLRERLTKLGADVVVTEDEFQSRDFKERLAEAMKEKSRGTGSASGGLRLGMNCVGGKSAQTMSKHMSQSGTIVTYGGMSRQPTNLPTGLLIFKDLRFRGFWLSRWADRDPQAKHRTINEILDLMRQGKFEDVPVEEVPWTWETEEGSLREAVQGTLDGFRSGKGMFSFKDV